MFRRTRIYNQIAIIGLKQKFEILNTILKEEREAEKKPVYESPKVSRLDEKGSLQGQGLQGCAPVGSGDLIGCVSGNNPGPVETPTCMDGNDGEELSPPV